MKMYMYVSPTLEEKCEYLKLILDGRGYDVEVTARVYLLYADKPNTMAPIELEVDITPVDIITLTKMKKEITLTFSESFSSKVSDSLESKPHLFDASGAMRIEEEGCEAKAMVLPFRMKNLKVSALATRIRDGSLILPLVQVRENNGKVATAAITVKGDLEKLLFAAE